MTARVHVAAAPGWDGKNAEPGEEHRVVQPCGRCGIVLSEFDEANPPMVAGPGPHTHAWWGVGKQVVRDPGYDCGTATYMSAADDDAGDPLCDPGEVPDETETFREQVEA